MEQALGIDRFEERGRLGEGAFGTVYRVWDRERQAVVALKLLRRADPAALYRFKREFRLVVDAAHPNLVSLYELLSEGDRACFTMELVEGVTFIAHVRGAEPPERWTRLRRALAQLGAGLIALHGLGTLHRDVKPSNVLVTTDRRVVLLDFGLAADRLGAALEAGSWVGSPAYVAPELLSGAAPSEAADWYACGVTLFEALTGRLPFAGSIAEIVAAKRRQSAPRARDVAPDAPEDLDDLCAALLARSPGDRAGAAEVARVAGVEKSRPVCAVAPPERASFVGRAAELERLDRALTDVRGGAAVTVCVRGPSGIGKSALVREWVRRVSRDPSAVVLAGRCHEQESVPYKGLDAVVDALGRWLGCRPADETAALVPPDAAAAARLFPTLAQSGIGADEPADRDPSPEPLELRRRALRALRGVVHSIAARWPLVLVIDDLQWSDLDSAWLLGELLRPPDAPPMLTVLVYRSEAEGVSPVLRDATPPETLARLGAEVRILTLGPLEAVDAEGLARALLGAAGQARASAVVSESRGNPFLVGMLCGTAPEADADSDAPLLERVLTSRLGALAESERRLLEVVAVAAHPIPRDAAGQAAALPEGWHGVLARLRAGLLVQVSVDGSGAVEPYHDRIREAVVTRLPAGTIAERHRALALALDGRHGVEPETLAAHFAAGGLRERAAENYVVAAERAEAALAFHRAAELYARALDAGRIGDGGPAAGATPARSTLELRRADALANAGRGKEAADAYLAAAAGLGDGDAFAARRKAAEQLLRAGHVSDGVALSREVLGHVGVALARTPRRALLSLVWRLTRLRWRGFQFRERAASEISADVLARIDTLWSVSAGLSVIDTLRAADLQVLCLYEALQAGEPGRVQRAITAHAAFTANRGAPRWPRVSRLLELAHDLARRTGDPYAAALATGIEGIARFHLGEWRRGRELCERAEPLFRERCAGAVKETATMWLFVLASLAMEGDLVEMRRRLPGYVRSAEERGDLFATTNLRSGLPNLVYLVDDDPAEARAQAEASIARWAMEDAHFQRFFDVLAQTHIDLYVDDGEAAWRRVEAYWPSLRRSLLLRTQWVRIQALWLRGRAAVSAARAARGRRALLQVAVRDARRLRAERRPWADPMADALDGAVLRARDDDGAAAALDLAAGGFERAEMRLFSAAARRAAASIRGTTDDDPIAAAGARRPDRLAGVFVPT